MKNSFLISIFAILYGVPSIAQLTIDNDYHVIIGDATPVSSPLTVGPLPYSTSYNIGVSSSVNPIYTQANVGAEGSVSIQNDTTCRIGIRGVVIPYSGSTNGRHFGVTGIYSGIGASYGTGILGSSTMSTYYDSPAINGKYAGYFLGDVYASGTLTASQVLTTSDIRLKDNIVLLEEKEDGQTTLNKLASLQVLQYNLKNKGDYDIPKEARKQIEEECPEVLQEIEKRKAEYTSKLHFGVSAQQLQDVYPNLVTEGQDGYLRVNYLEMLPVIIRSLQVLKHEVNEVKAARATFDPDGESIAEK